MKDYTKFINIESNIDDNLLINPVLAFRWFPYGINSEYFLVKNKFSELDTEKKRKTALTNLGIYDVLKESLDNLVNGVYWKYWQKVVDLNINKNNGSTIKHTLLGATDQFAGVMSAEDKINLVNSTVHSIIWNDSSNINNLTTSGVYNILGERLNNEDNLPILNSNPGHTINARLTVLDSSINGTGDALDKCITQILMLSNRTGGDGNTYIRTGSGVSLNSLSWKPWATVQTNTNVNQVDDLDNLKDNGIYSGVWTKGSYNTYPLTFVCVVINDYFIGIEPRRISQFVYGLSKFDGSNIYQSRVWDDSKNAWGNWEILNQKEISSMISSEISKIVDNAPETFNTLKEIADWINNDESGAAAMLKAINENKSTIEELSEVDGRLVEYITTVDEDYATKVSEIKSKALHYNSLHVVPTAEKVNIGGKSVDGANTLSMDIPGATTEEAGVMMATDKKKLNYLAEEGTDVDLNTYYLDGVYFFYSKRLTNVPILNDSVVSARLTVLTAYDGSSPVITQVLNLNNLGGGEGNIYIRSYQNGAWKPWGKLQTNVEVGQITPDDMSNLIDNGIYSGVCVDGTTVETFVLIVINNYLAASQAGFGSYVSQLKYSIDLNRGNTVKTRTRDAYGIWNEWSEISGSTYELPKATQDTLGGVRLGNTKFTNYAPLVNIGSEAGVGIGIDVNYFTKLSANSWLSMRLDSSLTEYGEGLSVRLGTTGDSSIFFPIIPCVIGAGVSSDDARWNAPAVGIRYNTEQFCLKYNGLNLVDGIGSGVTEVAWDANSDINNYITAGVYDIRGTRGSIYDYLPITNLGENATIAARLIVTVTPEGATTYRHSIGQTLILSNAEGKETKVYTRNGNRTIPTGGASYTITWSNWKCLQGMVESYINTNTVGITATGGQTTGLNGMIENGMYSGIYTDDYTLQSPTFVETFVLVVINDYAASSQAGTPRRISQLKYATDTLTGQCTVKKRVGTGSDSISWGDWEEIGVRSIIHQVNTIIEIIPNVLNLWEKVDNLDITLVNPINSNIINEYMIQFTSGETATTLTLPSNIKWLVTPNIQPNKTYQISIINNLGVIGEFNNE